MIPANPEKLEWGERQSSVALSEIRGKMDEMPRVQEARKSPANPFGLDEDGQDTLEGWKDRRSTTRSRRAKESVTLVNRGRGCFCCEWWNFSNEIFFDTNRKKKRYYKREQASSSSFNTIFSCIIRVWWFKLRFVNRLLFVNNYNIYR